MRIPPSAYFIIGVLIFTATLILNSLTLGNLQSKLLPLIFSSVVFILAAVQLIKELRTPEEADEQQMVEEIETEPADPLWKYWRSGAWIGGFCLAVYLLGFMISIPIFAFSYLKLHGRGWAVSITITAALPIFIYVVFGMFLAVDLYPGLLLELLS